MVNFSTNSFNPLANLKVSVRNTDGKSVNSAQSTISSKDINSHSSNSINSSQNSNNKVLGYEVDKDGYFTDEFNKAAGIPSDYKIHSSTMQSLVKSQTTTHNLFYFANFTSIDIAKTIGNAYKIVSQLLEKSPELAGKESFSQADLAAYFPRNYITNDAGEVVRTYTTDEAKEVVDLGGFTLGADEKLNLSFTTLRYTNGVVSDYDAFSFDGDILHSGMFGGKEGLYHFDTTSDKYTNADGTISKGGLLIGFLSHNTFAYNSPSPLIAGEVSIQGKINGLDKNTSQAEINSLLSFMQGNMLVLDSENYGEFNDLMSSNLSIDEFKQAYLKLKQDTENRRKNAQKSAEMTDPKTQAMKFFFDELQKMNERLSKGKLSSVKAQNDDLSWKFGTPWESVSDEELAKINTRLNNSFKVLADEYNKAAKDIVEVENSIEQQLVSGRLDKKELDKFIDENPLPLLANSLIDKDLMSVYKTSASLDEFKAKWLELKNEQTARLAKMFLQMGFEIEKGDLALSNFDLADTKFAHQIDIKA